MRSYRAAVFGNVGTLITFRCGERDARVLCEELSRTYSADAFTSLADYEAIMQVLDQGEQRQAVRARTHAQSRSRHGGLDVSVRTIVERVVAGDLVITADIPLAADVLQRRAAAVSPRGGRFHPDSIAQKLTVRDFLDPLRGSGVQTGGPPALRDRDKHQFATALDRWLVQRK